MIESVSCMCLERSLPYCNVSSYRPVPALGINLREAEAVHKRGWKCPVVVHSGTKNGSRFGARF